MRGITVGELREVIKDMNDRLPVLIYRKGEDDPVTTHCRREMGWLAIEVEDEDHTWLTTQLEKMSTAIDEAQTALDEVQSAL